MSCFVVVAGVYALVVLILLAKINSKLARLLPATSVEIRMPTNNSIVAGTSGVFEAVPNGAINPGTYAWVASDAAVVLTPSADGSQVTVAVPESDSNSGFTLSVSVQASNGVTLSASQSVTITPAAPAPATAVTIQQLS